ncbi:MAG: tetratricopeptide repeat protein [Myxococcota bacterium]
MGFWSWLFPSDEDRVRRARELVAAGRAEFARLEVLEVDRDDAREVLHQAEAILAERNLEAAIQYGRVGDDQRAADCLELAEQFDHGGLGERLADTRRELREIRGRRSAEEERRKADRNARLLQVDPLGLTGGPSWLDPVPSGDPFAPDEEEVQQRLALLVEQYPESLRGTVTELGPEFVGAVLAIEDGQPEQALPVLATLSDDAALVWWERARAAHALGDPGTAATALREFASRAGRHHPIGNHHTGVYLATCLAELGDLPAALRVLREVRAAEPKVGAFLFAQLLFATGGLPEAETVLTGMIRQHPKEAPLYGLLARVRVAGGHRVEAMRALEASFEAICCSPGKCGAQAPDLDTHRLLATLYLEDHLELPRALELADTAAALVQQPTWDDAYLRALSAKARNEPDAGTLIDRLRQLTPDGHPAGERITRYLAA